MFLSPFTLTQIPLVTVDFQTLSPVVCCPEQGLFSHCLLDVPPASPPPPADKLPEGFGAPFSATAGPAQDLQGAGRPLARMRTKALWLKPGPRFSCSPTFCALGCSSSLGLLCFLWQSWPLPPSLTFLLPVGL